MKFPMKSKTPTARHRAARDAILKVIREEMAETPADEILAVVSYTVGQLVAMQDQRRMTPDMAMEIVAANIKLGNEHALAEVLSAIETNAN